MDAIDREKFGGFLSMLRKEKGFTQKDLAQRLYVSDKAVSKWERGQSLPDISLLTPLSELLGVSVAELLKGERLTGEAPDSGKAVPLPAEEEKRRGALRRFWHRTWAACAVLAAVETMFVIMLNRLSAVELWDYLLLVEGLSLGIGAYFCFFAKETLPAYYDENKICAYSDGIFRMNLPGVCFNNSNWPQILAVGRGWPLGTAALWPPVFWLARGFFSEMAMLALTLTFCLSFFVPMIAVAKRDQ